MEHTDGLLAIAKSVAHLTSADATAQLEAGEQLFPDVFAGVTLLIGWNSQLNTDSLLYLRESLQTAGPNGSAYQGDAAAAYQKYNADETKENQETGKLGILVQDDQSQMSAAGNMSTQAYEMEEPLLGILQLSNQNIRRPI